MGRIETPGNHESKALAVRDLLATRPGGFVLRVAELEVGPGRAVAICGPSGIGKSSLLEAIVAHVRSGDPLAIAGRVAIAGRPLPAAGSADWRAMLRGPLCLIPQDARRAFDPLRQLGAQIAELAGVAGSRVEAALEELGIDQPSGIAMRFPHQVSGGQATRALLAVALLREAAVCVLDEPSDGLDRARVLDLVRALERLRTGASRTALVVTTHDHRLVAALGATAYRIADGRLVPGLEPEEPWPERERPVRGDEVVAACEGLGVRIGRSWLVEHCDLVVRRRESVALLGPSGAGKTTVGRVLAGSIAASRGRVHRPSRPRAVQMLFQDASGSLTPSRSIRSLLHEAAAPDFDLAAETIALGLTDALLDRSVAELSGGQRRRVALLRAIAVRPELLVLDEPTQALDRATARRVVAHLLDAAARHAMALLWITHDDDLAIAVADRAVRIHRGRT